MTSRRIARFAALLLAIPLAGTAQAANYATTPQDYDFNQVLTIAAALYTPGTGIFTSKELKAAIAKIEICGTSYVPNSNLAPASTSLYQPIQCLDKKDRVVLTATALSSFKLSKKPVKVVGDHCSEVGLKMSPAGPVTYQSCRFKNQTMELTVTFTDQKTY